MLAEGLGCTEPAGAQPHDEQKTEVNSDRRGTNLSSRCFQDTRKTHFLKLIRKRLITVEVRKMIPACRRDADCFPFHRCCLCPTCHLVLFYTCVLITPLMGHEDKRHYWLFCCALFSSSSAALFPMRHRCSHVRRADATFWHHACKRVERRHQFSNTLPLKQKKRISPDLDCFLKDGFRYQDQNYRLIP